MKIKRIIGKLRREYLFIMIIVVSIYFRFSGSSPGYPPYHSDEGISYSSALHMINNNLDPGRYDYPAVVPVVNYIFFKGLFIPFMWTKFYLVNFSQIINERIHLPFTEDEYQRIFQISVLGAHDVNALFWGRYVTAFTSTGVVVLSYLVSKNMFGKRAGLIAALLVGVSYRQVLNSHLGLPDIYNAFFLLASVLVSYELWKKPSTGKYILASVVAGISFATKYQFFAFFPLLLAHLYVVFSKPRGSLFKNLFNPVAVAVPFIILFVFLVINPYMFVHIEETRIWLAQVSGKYRTGRMELDVYPYSYLYHIGLGKFTAIGVVVSFFLSAFTKLKREWVLLASVILSFLFVTTFATGGGFYTRNFVTIIPFFMITISAFLTYLIKKTKFGWIIVIVFLVGSVYENVSKSMVVASEYRQPWNYEVLSTWVAKNIKEGDIVAAHSSVPLPVDGVTRVPYEQNVAFSIEEFRQENANIAIANLDWETSDFYWWMTVSFSDGIKYWNKPVKDLSVTYSAASLMEVSDYSIYRVVNSWQAPDSNFIVSKIPSFTIENEVEEIKYDFKTGAEDWIRTGNVYHEGGLVVGGGLLPKEFWHSKPIKVEGWNGFSLVGSVESRNETGTADGYIMVRGYKSENDATNDVNREFVRLTIRNEANGEINTLSLSRDLPTGIKYIVISFHSYDPSVSVSKLRTLTIYKADVMLQNSEEYKPFTLDDKLIYPESHGYL